MSMAWRGFDFNFRGIRGFRVIGGVRGFRGFHGIRVVVGVRGFRGIRVMPLMRRNFIKNGKKIEFFFEIILYFFLDF